MTTAKAIRDSVERGDPLATAVLTKVRTRLTERAAPPSLPAARTLVAPGDGTYHVAAGEVGELAGSERGDLDAVEHERQNRLRRWREQP